MGTNLTGTDTHKYWFRLSSIVSVNTLSLDGKHFISIGYENGRVTDIPVASLENAHQAYNQIVKQIEQLSKGSR